jgi:hypothetical protein
MHGVVGIEHPTAESAVLGPSGLTMLGADLESNHGGDGTVPRVSASPMEAQDDSTAMFAGTRHASLQNTDAVLTQLRGWLEQVDLTDFRAGAPVRLSVELDDVYRVGEPVAVTVTPNEATAEIRYELQQLADPGVNEQDQLPAPVTGSVSAIDGANELEIAAPGPGLYRLTLSGDKDVEPVSDLLVVAPG